MFVDSFGLPICSLFVVAEKSHSGPFELDPESVKLSSSCPVEAIEEWNGAEWNGRSLVVREFGGAPGDRAERSGGVVYQPGHAIFVAGCIRCRQWMPIMNTFSTAGIDSICWSKSRINELRCFCNHAFVSESIHEAHGGAMMHGTDISSG